MRKNPYPGFPYRMIEGLGVPDVEVSLEELASMHRIFLFSGMDTDEVSEYITNEAYKSLLSKGMAKWEDDVLHLSVVGAEVYLKFEDDDILRQYNAAYPIDDPRLSKDIKVFYWRNPERDYNGNYEYRARAYAVATNFAIQGGVGQSFFGRKSREDMMEWAAGLRAAMERRAHDVHRIKAVPASLTDAISATMGGGTLFYEYRDKDEWLDALREPPAEVLPWIGRRREGIAAWAPDMTVNAKHDDTIELDPSMFAKMRELAEAEEARGWDMPEVDRSVWEYDEPSADGDYDDDDDFEVPIRQEEKCESTNIRTKIHYNSGKFDRAACDSGGLMVKDKKLVDCPLCRELI
jgi:hypothetical protein